MIRFVIGTTLVVASSQVMAQDPTLPSQALVQRLQLEKAVTAPPLSENRPAIHLKALVMADADHGMALLEADSRRFVVQLDRALLNAKPEEVKEELEQVDQRDPRSRIELSHGAFYVEDFSATSIVLSNGQQQITIRSTAIQ